MSLDEQLRTSATDLRRDAERLAGSMAPPSGASHRGSGVTIGVVATIVAMVVGLAVLVAVRDDPASTSDRSPAPPFEPVRDRPGHFRHDSGGVEFWIPSSGWRATTETLTPSIDDVDVSGYRDADTLLSLSTTSFPDTRTADASDCPTMPFAALAELTPTDALVSVIETSFDELPERRRATGIYDGEPKRLYPSIGEVDNGWCLDRIRRLGDADLFHRTYPFTDAGRSFVVHVALGSATTPDVQRDTWQILDRLTFTSPSDTTPN